MTGELSKTITLELTPAQFEQLLELQPDEARLPQLAHELICQALRESMDIMPGRKTRPVAGDAP